MQSSRLEEQRADSKERSRHAEQLGIPLRDKMLLHLKEQANCKKKQLKEDYKQLKASVHENPYLQAAVDEYDKYFAVQQKQLHALQTLLKTIELPADQRTIQREIAALEKNLA